MSRARSQATRAVVEPPVADSRRGTPGATKALLVGTLALTALALWWFLAEAAAEPIDPGFAASFLWLFLGLFALRVGGQVVVRLRAPSWLPPTEQWNLMPYRLLVPAQLLILAVMVWIAVDFSRGEGTFATPRPGLATAVLWFSFLYAGAMAVRYCVRMQRRPEERWFGGTIPIVFHVVLASFLFVLATYHGSY